MRGNRLIPETQREWKAKKRKEWKEVLKAANIFLLGSSFTPTVGLFYPDMLKTMHVIKRKLSTKEWGR